MTSIGQVGSVVSSNISKKNADINAIKARIKSVKQEIQKSQEELQELKNNEQLPAKTKEKLVQIKMQLIGMLQVELARLMKELAEAGGQIDPRKSNSVQKKQGSEGSTSSSISIVPLVIPKDQATSNVDEYA